MKLLYFAWVRERIGVHEEDYALPVGVSTVGDLIAHLAARGDGYARAFADPMQIRAAVNQRRHSRAIPWRMVTRSPSFRQ